ncbi:hypothetical protein CLONEX_00422 [[Clostridium] nexile DSM 1787]|nr:hypothetical protein CLONEX_00422 [[Clostridium] nexile DSM 1787]
MEMISRKAPLSVFSIMYVRTKIFVLFHLQILTMNEKYVRIRALYFRRYSFFYSTIRQFCQRFQLRKKE